MTAPTVFISYSNRDHQWFSRLRLELEKLELDGLIRVWSDQHLEPGDLWLEEIRSQLEIASVAICLVSKNFISSRFIAHEEIPRFLERRAAQGVRIIPILIEECDWQRVRWIRERQFFPRGQIPVAAFGDRAGDILAEAANKVRMLVKPVLEPKPAFKMLPPSEVAVSRLQLKGEHFIGRKMERDLLDAAWMDQKTKVISIVGWGGSGKTALLSTWLASLAKDNYRGAESVIAWSFRSEGDNGLPETADTFLEFALRKLGDEAPQHLTSWDRAERLADRCRTTKTLLVLDAIEALQEPAQDGLASIADPGLKILLRELAAQNMGLCVLTTRTPILDLAPYFSTTAPRIDLEPMTASEGASLLRSLEVEGEAEELEKASDEFGGHCLALNLLGTYVRDFLDGDILRRHEVVLLDQELGESAQAQTMLREYEARFKDSPEGEILRIVSLCRNGAEGPLEAVRSGPNLPGLTSHVTELSTMEWKKAVRRLLKSGLLTVDKGTSPPEISAHPLVREYFRQRLYEEAPKSFKEANHRLYRHFYKSSPKDARNLVEMEPLFSAVEHGCRAGKEAEAFRTIYRERIVRNEEYFIGEVLGAYGSALRVITSFFVDPWKQVRPALGKAEKALAFGETGFYLMALGRIQESLIPMERSIQCWNQTRNKVMATNAVSNYVEALYKVGRLKDALKQATIAVRSADQSKAADWRVRTRVLRAQILYDLGNLDDAQKAFESAESLQAKTRGTPRLHAINGFQYCNFLLDGLEDLILDGPPNGSRLSQACVEVSTRVRESQELKKGLHPGADHPYAALGLDWLTLSRATLAESVLNGSRVDAGPILDLLSQAQKDLLAASRLDYLPIVYLTRALVSLVVERDVQRAREDALIALKRARRSGLKLLEIDSHLIAAKIFSLMGNPKDSATHFLSASQYIDESSYHRRDELRTKLMLRHPELKSQA